ncbi:MAG TPA: hypothetical protein VGV57_01125 [Thermoleophilaceae bacterium]|nr:hypothetical protein [Thermoleophilaceae bacterium]
MLSGSFSTIGHPQNFLTCDRDQPLLLPPDLRDWLAADHLAWFVIEDRGALPRALYAAYRSDGHGAPPPTSQR